DQKIIRAFGITGHANAVLMIECIKRFDPDTVLTFFLGTRPDNGRYETELIPLARNRKMGVIGMKAIRYGRQAKLPATELLRYTLSLDGVRTVVVGRVVTCINKSSNVSFAAGVLLPWSIRRVRRSGSSWQQKLRLLR